MGETLPEPESWRMAATVMLIISVVIFLVQRFVAVFLDLIFEFCIFHLSSLVAVVIYLRKRRQPSTARRLIEGG